MLRSTESSIIFTQLGRGLRKFPYKDSVVVIDFIGNYNNNYLIPVACTATPVTATARAEPAAQIDRVVLHASTRSPRNAC